MGENRRVSKGLTLYAPTSGAEMGMTVARTGHVLLVDDEPLVPELLEEMYRLEAIPCIAEGGDSLPIQSYLQET